MPHELEQQIEMYSEYLLKLAFVYVKDKQIAEDIVQEAFIQYFYAKSYKEQGQLKSYLTTITVNRSKNYLKSWAYRKLQLKESFQGRVVKKQDALVEEEERKRIGDAIFQLSIEYRELVFFYYYEEKKVREIAELLNLSENTVKTRLRKARLLLKEQLSNEQWEVLQDESYEGSI